MMRITLMLGMLVLMLCAVPIVSAQVTQLNITMTETVNQNITFAENFNLVESQKSCIIIGVVNISNPTVNSVQDINLTFVNTDNMTGNFTFVEGRTGSQVGGVNPGDTYIIHITELMTGNWSTFNYTIDCSSLATPMNVDTTYWNPDTGINRKVLAGRNWTVYQNVSNQLAIGVAINNINITMKARNVNWNGTSDQFLLANLNTSGDYLNVHGNGTSTSQWWWQVNGGTLAPSASQNISFIMTAPDNVPTSNTYRALEEVLEYRIFFLASNLTLTDVRAVGDIDFALDKQIIGPATNNNDSNVTWRVDPDITVPINMSFTLETVTLWVTSTLDPSDYNNPTFGPINTTYTVNSEINQTVAWNGADWDFNFSDSSHGHAPPIVWMRPYFTVMNAYNQIINSTITQNGNDIYMKYIYVINGYWLQIDKNITNIGPDKYRIDTLVENVGNAWTPEGLVVTAYDFVPVEFGAWNFSESFDANSSVSGGGFNGTSYRWTIPAKAPYDASLGPASETYLNRTWNVTYFVNGSGDYRVSELYIVGLDPRKVDGAGAHQGIAMFSALGTASAEVFYVAIVLFLVVINVVNFVMTRRINHKLNKK